MNWTEIETFEINGRKFRINFFVPFNGNGGLKAYWPDGGYTAGIETEDGYCAFTMSPRYDDLEYKTLEECRRHCERYAARYGRK